MADVISGPPGVTVIPCPLPECRWAHLVEPPGPADHPGALADIFGWGVFSATAAADRARRTEEALRDHFATHGLAEWIAEIARLRDENTRLREAAAGVREDEGS